MKANIFKILLLSLSFIFIATINAQSNFKLDYEKYVLPNRLQVILHQAKSYPISPVTIQFHVGSNREI
ncbi:MAG TPA: hypothetical protein PKE38_16905, partial [Ignavibacteriaceae bacterium]|nr:hypothetical protein [Ignavibacteriaceae bacterium]